MTFSDEIMGHAAPVPVRWKAFSERALRGSWVHLLLLARTFGLDSRSGCGALAIFFQTMLLVSYLASAKMRSAHFAGCPANELGVRKSFLSKWFQAQQQAEAEAVQDTTLVAPGVAPGMAVASSASASAAGTETHQS